MSRGVGRVFFLYFQFCNLQQDGSLQFYQGWILLIEVLDLLEPLQRAAESLHSGGFAIRDARNVPGTPRAGAASHATIVNRLRAHLNATDR
jgi:hypothetical protein